MVQIKTFSDDATDKDVNQFLKKKKEANIIGIKPYVIQYEQDDDFEQVLLIIKGPPTQMRIGSYTKNKYIQSGMILVMQSCLVFVLKGKQRLSIDLATFNITNQSNKKLYPFQASFITFGNEEDYGVRLDFSSWGEKLISQLADFSFFVDDNNYQYNKRTLVLEKVGIMNAKAKVEAASIQAHATMMLAKAVLIGGLAQAEAQSMSERDKMRIENVRPFHIR